MLPTSKLRFFVPLALARDLAASITPGDASMPIASAGSTRCARPDVIVPGPQPTSSKRIPGLRNGRKKAAVVSAVRVAWLATTVGWWPC